MKLVIIEDEEPHFELMKRAVERSFPSASILHCQNPQVCIDKLGDFSPDLIIVDYLMPEMNGIDFLRALGRENINIPVVMITGQGDENIAVQAMKLGAWDYLVKSVDCFTLLPSIIEKVVREKELRDSLRESARLNDLLLNSLPHPAILIRRDRIILTANRIAEESGARKGDYCWSHFGHCDKIPEKDKAFFRKQGNLPSGGIKCSYCLADEALESGQPKHQPDLEALGKLWDTWWVPINHDLFLFYAFDVTDRKRSEEHIHRLTQQLMKTQETERKKLSCDLHDVIGQDLSTLKIGLDTLVCEQLEFSAQLQERIARLSQMLQNIISSVRNLAYTLRPPSLDELGLVLTIHQYCEEFSATHEFQASFLTAGMDNIDLDFDTRIALYRLVQEGLNNVYKHAEATNATIKLVASFPNIILLIEDNGKGFDVQSHLTAATKERGMGLRGMKERVGLLNGTMRIESRPLQGTKIRIEFPFKESTGGR